MSWEALDDVRPGDVTVRTAADRLRDDDGWAALLPEPQELPADLLVEGHAIPVARVVAMHEGRRRKKAERDAAGD